MRAGVLCLLLGLAGCADPDGSGDDDDVVVGGDGDADGDADAPPRCEDEVTGFVSAYGRGDWQDELSIEHPMAVVVSGPDELRLEEDLSCDPSDEVSLFLASSGVPDEAWLPPVGAAVMAVLTQTWESGYGVLRSPDGVLLWEGGDPSSDAAVPPRFRIVDEPQAEPCTDREISCVTRAPIQVAVLTDDGEVPLDSGEQRVVTVDGEPYMALVAAAYRSQVEPGCGADMGGGPWAAATLVRTTPTDLPMVERVPAPTDECPADAPAEWDPCTTRPNLQCDFDRGQGCIDGMECDGCFWRMRIQSQPDGVNCGLDPWDCMLVDDGACSEEAVCTDCSCPDPIGERWRCVQPGDGCPACA